MQVMLDSDLAELYGVETKALNQTVKRMRHFISENLKVSQKFEIIEKKQIEYQLESDKKFDMLFKALENNELHPKQGILFEGQVFEAHKFVSDIVRFGFSKMNIEVTKMLARI
jgi:hypothetical protein